MTDMACCVIVEEMNVNAYNNVGYFEIQGVEECKG